VENRWASDRDRGAGMMQGPGILIPKQTDAPSVFRPENLLRESRRQRGLRDEPVPAVCALDPDGDMVRTLRTEGRAQRVPGWACYHTDMYETQHCGVSVGIVGCAVGAPFAVLVAEQLFVSGCRFLVSITSAGQIEPVVPTPYFVLIDRALRDEGTSHHYLPPSPFAEADPGLADRAFADLSALPLALHRGTSWTTDAPYRETEEAIGSARRQGVLAVEMEAAALYAFACAQSRPLLCFAHVTNQMARIKGDFEKGEADGTRSSLDVIATAARACGFGPAQLGEVEAG
jgi:uridine phosphorylase